MKQIFSLFVLSMLLTTLPIGLQAQTGFLLNVGFEEGALPDDWDVKNEVGASAWSVVSGGHHGDYCVALRATDKEQGYRSMLILPPQNTSMLFQPIMVFSHRQQQWTGDIDTLCVMYRTDAEKPFRELRRFVAGAQRWTSDTVVLDGAVGRTGYQIALLGIGNMGRGIEVDDILIRSTPQCSAPTGVNVSEISNISAVLRWGEVFDAGKYRIVVSKSELTKENLAAEGVPDAVVDTLLDYQYLTLPLTNLEQLTTYYVYVASVCQADELSWSPVVTFATTDMTDLPLYEDFNMEYNADIKGYLEDWFYGGDRSEMYQIEYKPWISNGLSISKWNNHSHDGTTSLMFYGKSETYGIEGGHHSYIASPRINVEKIEDLQVTFEARVGTVILFPMGTAYRHSVIVGVMTDPLDYGTFEPVDTVDCDLLFDYYDFSVSLSNYSGKGKYVALASDFVEINNITIDNIRIEMADKAACPTDVKAAIVSASSVDLTWQASGNTRADVMVLDSHQPFPDKYLEEGGTALKRYEGVQAAGQYTLEGLTPWSVGYIYVRNVTDEGAGPWSAPVMVRMPQRMATTGVSFDFEIEEGDPSTWYNVFGSNYDKEPMALNVLGIYYSPQKFEMPVVDNEVFDHPDDFDAVATSQWQVKMHSGMTTPYNAIVLPEMDDIRKYRLSFSSAQFSRTNQASLVVGVMSVANDFSTFKPIKEIKPELDYNTYVIDLDICPEDIEGKFVAFANTYEINNHLCADIDVTTVVYVDDVKVVPIPECRQPYDVEITQVVGDAGVSIDMTWAKKADKYDIRLSHKHLTPADFENPSYAFAYTIDGNTTGSVHIDNLTPGQRLYYYIRPICGETTGEWSTPVPVRIDCPARQKLPYRQSFDGIVSGDLLDVSCVSAVMGKVYLNGNYFTNPSLDQLRSNVYNGDGALCIGSTRMSSDRYQQLFSFALPDMDTEKISDLQMTFVMKTANVGALDATKVPDPIMVGVMQGDDLSTFEKVVEVAPKVNGEWDEFVVNFDGYAGSGRNIAFKVEKTATYQNAYIDSIVIEPRKACQKAIDLGATNITANTADLFWTSSVADSYDIVLASAPVADRSSLDNAVEGTGSVVKVVNVNANPATITGLIGNSRYYWYVRGVCGTDRGYWNYAPGDFRTACGPTTMGVVDGFENVEVGTSPLCWVVSAPGADPEVEADRYYIPHVSTDWAYEGSTSLAFHNVEKRDKNNVVLPDATYSESYAVSPEIGENILDLEVSFYASCTGAKLNAYNSAKLVVGIVPSPYEMDAFFPADTIEVGVDERFFRVRFDKFKTDDPDAKTYMALYSVAPEAKYVSNIDCYSYNDVYVDNVRFDKVGECASPVNLTVSEATGSSVTVNWRGGTAPYDVLYADHLLSDEQLAVAAGTMIEDVAATQVEITALVPNTDYYVYARSTCEGAQWSAPAIVATSCGEAYTLPFRDDFDRNQFTGTGYNPACWTTYYSYEGHEKDYPYLNTAGYQDKAIYMYAYNASRQSYAVLPKLDVEDLTRCYISFRTRTNVADCYRGVVVGLVNDVSTPDTIIKSFYPIDTVTISSTEYEKYIVLLQAPASYNETPKYVAFRSIYELNTKLDGTTKQAGGYYLDNIEVDKYMPVPRPAMIDINLITDTEIGGVFAELGTATAWQGLCVVSGSDITGVTPQSLTDKKFNFTGLTPATDYDIYLRSTSTEANSPWSNPITVTTTQVPPTTSSYSTGFEAADDNQSWVLVNAAANEWVIGEGGKKDGQGGLFISHNGAEARYDYQNASVSWAYRTLRLMPGEYTFDYDWICIGEKTGDFMRIGLLPTAAMFEAENPNIAFDNRSIALTAADAAHPAWIDLCGRDAELNQRFYLSGSDYENISQAWSHTTVSGLIIDEEACYNLVVMWCNNNENTNGAAPSAIIDNLTVKHSPCVQPIDLDLVSSDENQTTISWQTLNDMAVSYDLFLTNNAELLSPDYAIDLDRVREVNGHPSKQYTFTDLEPWSMSYVFVRSVCADGSASDWSAPLCFRTDCARYPTGHTFSFEKEEGINSNGRKDLPNCFAISTAAVQTASSYLYMPYIEPNSSYTYARTGLNALRLSHTTLDNAGGYAILPRVALPEGVESLDGYRLSFWLSATCSNSSNKMSTTYLGTDYSRSITVGYLTDTADFSTLHELETVVYPYDKNVITSTTTPADDPNGNAWWYHVEVDLPAECSDYIVLYDKAVTKKNQVYIDDLAIERIPNCAAPSRLTLLDLRGNSAQLSFVSDATEGVTWVAECSLSEDMSDSVHIVIDDMNRALIDNLQSNTTYYVRVKKVCAADDQSSWSEILQFTTPYVTPMTETFTLETKCPKGWMRYAANNLDSINHFFTNGKLSLFVLSETISTAGWMRNDLYMDSEHQALTCDVSATGNRVDYLFTSSIDLEENADCQLMFDLALTDSKSELAPNSDALHGTSIFFAVAVSPDAGLTWQRTDATIWSNRADADHPLSDLNEVYQRISIDLSQFKGKVIQIAFIGGAYATSIVEEQVNLDIRIDNIRVNRVISKVFDQDICQYSGYTEHGFDIAYDEPALGANYYERFEESTDALAADTIYRLSLNVNTLSTVVFEETVCANKDYTEHNFFVPRGQGGEFKQKFAFEDGRCDSVVTLHLSVLPVAESHTDTTICQGQSFTWSANGKTYTESIVETITLESNLTRCDSVVTLLLNVIPAVPQHIEVWECNGETYDFNGRPLTGAGLYYDTVYTEQGCIDITELTLNYYPQYYTEYSAVICKGDTYTDQNFEGVTETGSYPNVLESIAGGCDSTVVLNLVVLGGDTTYVRKEITTAQLPYTIAGSDITYDVNTQPGEYVDTILVEHEDCHDVMIHTLVVSSLQAVDNVSEQPITLLPNPVNRGDQVELIIPTSGEISVAIYDTYGASIWAYQGDARQVATQTTAGYSMIITADFPSGVYLVHMLDADGRQWQGKLVVR